MLLWFIATALAAPSDWTDQETGALGLACDSALESAGANDATARLAMCACAAGEVMEATDPAGFQADLLILQNGMNSCLPRMQELLPDSDFSPIIRSLWGEDHRTLIRGLCAGITGSPPESDLCACFTRSITGQRTVAQLEGTAEGELEPMAEAAVAECGGDISTAPYDPAAPSPELQPEPEPEPEPEEYEPSTSSFSPGFYAAWDKSLGATDRDRAFTLGLEMPLPGPRVWLQWQREDIFGSRTNKIEVMWDLRLFARKGFALEANLGGGYAYGDEKGLGLLVAAEAEYQVALSPKLSFFPFVRVSRPLLYSFEGSVLREPMLHVGLEVQL